MAESSNQPPPAPEEPGVEPSSTAGLTRAHRRHRVLGTRAPGSFAPTAARLITSGNGGSVKPPACGSTTASTWRELSNQCGATDGRIAWAGPDESGCARTDAPGSRSPPAASPAPRWPTTRSATSRLVRRGRLKSSVSDGSVPFLGTSYQAMHAAGRLSSADRWFRRRSRCPNPRSGRSCCNWNGACSRRSPTYPKAAPSGTRVSVRRAPSTRACRLGNDDHVVVKAAAPACAALDQGGGDGEESPFESVRARKPPALLLESEFAIALDYLRLERGRRLAAGPRQARRCPVRPKGTSRPAGVTIRCAKALPGAVNSRSVIGPQPKGDEELPPPGRARPVPEARARTRSAPSPAPRARGWRAWKGQGTSSRRTRWHRAGRSA